VTATQELAMPTVTVKRFVRRFPEGVRYFSIRRRDDGIFQLWDDDKYRGIYQPDVDYDFPISGLFADLQTAEAELLRSMPYLEPE
jgi:hypothetical protein